MRKLEESDIRMLEYRIKEYQGEKNLIEQILKELDCTIVYADGSRPRQTNSFVFQTTDAEFHYLINKLCDMGLSNDDYNSYINRYNSVMDNNRAFEVENPPIVYEKKTKGTKKSVRIDKVKSMFTGETLEVGTKAIKKKETIKERKEKLLNNKAFHIDFNKLKLNK